MYFGTHKGLIHYTIGQRKGLGIAHETPLYVVDLDAQNNRLIVGEEEDIFIHKKTNDNRTRTAPTIGCFISKKNNNELNKRIIVIIIKTTFIMKQKRIRLK